MKRKNLQLMVPLGVHLKALMDERDRLYGERHKSQQEAQTITALAFKEYRVDSNEWRGTLTDFTARMPTNVDIDRRFSTVLDQLADLKKSRDTSSGQSAGSISLWGILAVAGGLAIAAVGAFVTVIMAAVTLYVMLKGNAYPP